MDVDKFVELPLYLQVILGGGYLAYLVARQGYRHNETASDIAFGVLAFGLPSLPAWWIVSAYTDGVILASVIAVLLCVLIGLWWRVSLADVWHQLMHRLQISNDDGLGDVWSGLIQNTSAYPTQITIYLKTGERLRCSDTFAFNDSAIGTSSWFDKSGNVAFFANESWQDGEWVEVEEVNHTWGDKLTYIPASEIARMEIRYMGYEKS